MRIFVVALGLLGVVHALEIAKLRRLMVDSRFVGLVSPCNTGGTTRTTAAEWLRTAFHDAASHDSTAGTGGIDGSIAYELAYSENGGSAFTATITQFESLQQEGVGMADMIVLGAITAVGACGGPIIPFNPGRIDASSAAPEGSVPVPESSLESHTQTFARMGFSQTEMIALIACGHTIGQVHKTVNPTLVPSGTIRAFDNTRTAFDNHVAIDYMSDNRTNPMAQPYDASYPERSSDARIFAADNNVTIAKYAASSDVYMQACHDVLLKMFDSAVPSSVSLSSTIQPFPVSTTFRTSLRNEAFHLQIGSSRLYNMVGQWSSFDIGYTNRDGTVGTSSTLLFVRTLRQISNGNPIQVRDFTTRSPGIPASTGIGSVFVTLKLTDGTTYSSTEGEEVSTIDDTILIDIGAAYTCTYSGTANSNANGINVTMAVLGPYSAKDKVEVMYRTTSGAKSYIQADYRRARDDYYNYYSIFIPDIDALSLSSFGARVTKADGSEHVDDRNGIYYTTSVLDACLSTGTIFAAGPRASSNPTRRHVIRTKICGRNREYCDGMCVDTTSDLEHCGGCARHGGVDCTTLTDGDVACVNGKCVFAPVPSRRLGA